MQAAKKKTEPAQSTTVKIDRETAEKLNIYCRKNGLTKKDFLSLSLGYFERTGIDPRSNDVANDLQELKQGIETVIKLQADAAVKLTGIAQTTEQTYLKQEDTARMLETNNEKPRKWWQFGK